MEDTIGTDDPPRSRLHAATPHPRDESGNSNRTLPIINGSRGDV